MFLAKMIPKMSAEQKEVRKEICSDLLQRIEDEPDLLKSVITCDETWIFRYAPEVTILSEREREMHEPFEIRSQVDIKSVSMAEWVPSCQMVNEQYYIELFSKLGEQVSRKRLEL
ncbi:hypothetical protein L798_08780 [Zootermopsis nevadensis]|uniref:Histone-lysine N-methyltransferase SETMAR n=1 Tax=Zootermopsis nevadensis TaxID=136037 RepID=A0A067RCI3_ZOONE|nr:hypothetical protein L798_08780 [Zootermopsis nevadensis]